jgi:NAD(P)-dependent dehydrogenase (short-subunit alcohol dehydrogenase family)
LEGKVAVVTGGGSGLGKGIAKRFLQEGAKVAICGRREAKLEEAAGELGKALPVRCDVGDDASVREMVSRVVKEYGRLDILVNAAGIRGAVGKAEEIDLAEWEETLRVNTTGPLLCARHAVPEMRKVGGGSLVLIGSMRITHVKAGAAAYCVSKGALVHLTRVMALDYAADHIRVNLLNPALVLTDFTRYVVDGYADPEEGKRKFGATYPLGRIGTENDIAEAALYLASDASSWVTGTSLNVDGGMSAV